LQPRLLPYRDCHKTLST